MMKSRIPIYYLLLCAAGSSAATFLLTKRLLSANKVAEAATETASAPVADACNYDITRLAGYKYIRPIMSATQQCEAKSLSALKVRMMDYIDNVQKSGNVINASVFIRALSNDDWTAVNTEETYHPASLLKVPQLITFLRMAEKDPKLLNREFLFTKQEEDLPVQYYSAKTLQPGHTYSIKELFHFMIAYSDNNANMELIKRMDMDKFKSTFTDLQLKAPDLSDANFTMSAKDYSKFLEVLYNAAYLNMEYSEYATELLAEAAFKDGIVKQIPSSVRVAHKMGEWGDGQTVELHDCGIVYLNNNPYIITVMTRGKDMEKLAETVSNISKMTYDAMAGPAM